MGAKTQPGPVETYKLYRAEWILENRGLTDFLDYCDAEDFTPNDIEAVQNKVNKVFKLSTIKDMLRGVGKPVETKKIETEEIPF